jgi:hypothetical protein
MGFAFSQSQADSSSQSRLCCRTPCPCSNGRYAPCSITFSPHLVFHIYEYAALLSYLKPTKRQQASHMVSSFSVAQSGVPCLPIEHYRSNQKHRLVLRLPCRAACVSSFSDQTSIIWWAEDKDGCAGENLALYHNMSV